jgi:hypothetical protein
LSVELSSSRCANEAFDEGFRVLLVLCDTRLSIVPLLAFEAKEAVEAVDRKLPNGFLKILDANEDVEVDFVICLSSFPVPSVIEDFLDGMMGTRLRSAPPGLLPGPFLRGDARGMPLLLFVYALMRSAPAFCWAEVFAGRGGGAGNWTEEPPDRAPLLEPFG